MLPRTRSGKALTLRDLDWIPGPGAADPRVAPLVAAYENSDASSPRPIPAPEKLATPKKPKKGKSA